jgi:uncharacterized membrane protein (DUF485 family)
MNMSAYNKDRIIRAYTELVSKENLHATTISVTKLNSIYILLVG